MNLPSTTLIDSETVKENKNEGSEVGKGNRQVRGRRVQREGETQQALRNLPAGFSKVERNAGQTADNVAPVHRPPPPP